MGVMEDLKVGKIEFAPKPGAEYVNVKLGRVAYNASYDTMSQVEDEPASREKHKTLVAELNSQIELANNRVVELLEQLQEFRSRWSRDRAKLAAIRAILDGDD